MDKTKQKIAFSFLIAIFLAAFEGVVVSTAAPVIVKSLHNFKMISWIFSIFLLTQQFLLLFTVNWLTFMGENEFS